MIKLETAQDAIDKYVRSVYASRSENTGLAYHKGMKNFSEFLAQCGVEQTSSIDKLSIEHFIEYPEWVASHGYARLTISVYAASVKGFMDWLVIHDIISPEYRHGVRIAKAYKELYKKRENKLVRFPKKDDIEKMRKAVYLMQDKSPIRERNIAIIEFLASSGCRNAEITGMRVSDVDLKERSAIVTGKGRKERRVFFSPEACEAIRNYWELRKFSNPTDYTFCRHDKGSKNGEKHQGITTTTTRNVIKLVAILAGVDLKTISPHYFRHDFAIKMLRKTGNLAIVQDLMGHASPQSTRVYAKIYPDELQKAHRELYG
jgi:site-specific recombinase XerD